MGRKGSKHTKTPQTRELTPPPPTQVPRESSRELTPPPSTQVPKEPSWDPISSFTSGDGDSATPCGGKASVLDPVLEEPVEVEDPTEVASSQRPMRKTKEKLLSNPTWLAPGSRKRPNEASNYDRATGSSATGQANKRRNVSGTSAGLMTEMPPSDAEDARIVKDTEAFARNLEDRERERREARNQLSRSHPAPDDERPDDGQVGPGDPMDVDDIPVPESGSTTLELPKSTSKSTRDGGLPKPGKHSERQDKSDKAQPKSKKKSDKARKGKAKDRAHKATKKAREDSDDEDDEDDGEDDNDLDTDSTSNSDPDSSDSSESDDDGESDANSDDDLDDGFEPLAKKSRKHKKGSSKSKARQKAARAEKESESNKAKARKPASRNRKSGKRNDVITHADEQPRWSSSKRQEEAGLAVKKGSKRLESKGKSSKRDKIQHFWTWTRTRGRQRLGLGLGLGFEQRLGLRLGLGFEQRLVLRPPSQAPVQMKASTKKAKKSRRDHSSSGRSKKKDRLAIASAAVIVRRAICLKTFRRPRRMMGIGIGNRQRREDRQAQRQARPVTWLKYPKDGKRKLGKKAQDDPIDRMMTKMNDATATHILFGFAFPDFSEQTRNEYEAVCLDVAREYNAAIYTRMRDDGLYRKLILSVPMGRISIYRGPFKTAAEGVVRTHFAINPAEPVPVLAIQNALTNHKYIYPLVDNSQRAFSESAKFDDAAEYLNPAISEVIHHELFSKRAYSDETQFVSGHEDFPDEKEVPAALVALAATAIHGAISDLCAPKVPKAPKRPSKEAPKKARKSRAPGGYFDSGYAAVYNDHRDRLRRALNKDPLEYHHLLHAIYKASNCRAGPGGDQVESDS
ncbi:hypothetical protein BC834DRAFT_845600 [Gloeopeniophorella convolvens]|nr:hypothetical protein BC834DRAFT_845600 [Gloeopeniophorella convolvens]